MSGRDQEFREFIRNRASLLHQSAYLLCGDWHLAHDLVQDTSGTWSRPRTPKTPGGYQRAFRHLFDGTVERYDPWDATRRTTGPQYAGSTMCSAFRTFQGWTALCDMGHDQGVLHTVPIPEAMGYLMLRPLLTDVPEDDMCGVTVNQVFPVSRKWHEPLLPALTGCRTSRPATRSGGTAT